MKRIILQRFIIYGLIGICLEIFWTGLNSFARQDLTLAGQSNMWMFLIYGLAIFLEPIHDYIRGENIIIRGLVYMVLIFMAEYITGNLLSMLIGKCPWYYTDNLSMDGFITLSYIPVWFTLGLFFENFHDFLNKSVIIRKRD